jgi:hypothetical protein
MDSTPDSPTDIQVLFYKTATVKFQKQLEMMDWQAKYFQELAKESQIRQQLLTKQLNTHDDMFRVRHQYLVAQSSTPG